MKSSTTPASVWRNPRHFLAFGFGFGAIPFAPGTWGTVIAIPFYLLIRPLSLASYLIITVLVTLVGVWLCHTTAKDINYHDHPGIVWDEIAGFFVTMTNAPQQWYWVLIGFILFRIFDIIKPFPIKYLDQKIGGGLGIMMDDIAAGIFAFICLQVIIWLSQAAG